VRKVNANSAEPDCSLGTSNITINEALLSGAQHALRTALLSVEAAMELLQEARHQSSQKAIVSERSIGNLPERKGGYFQEAKDQE
jgi:hypothetical protein